MIFFNIFTDSGLACIVTTGNFVYITYDEVAFAEARFALCFIES